MLLLYPELLMDLLQVSLEMVPTAEGMMPAMIA
jgi:hypothetical protein